MVNRATAVLLAAAAAGIAPAGTMGVATKRRREALPTGTTRPATPRGAAPTAVGSAAKTEALLNDEACAAQVQKCMLNESFTGLQVQLTLANSEQLTFLAVAVDVGTAGDAAALRGLLSSQHTRGRTLSC